MVNILDSTSVFAKANAEREKWEKSNPYPSVSEPNDQNPDSTQGEHLKKNDEKSDAKGNQGTEQPPPTFEKPPTTKAASQMSTALVFHPSEIKTSEETSTEDEPPSKRPRFEISKEILSPTPLSLVMPQNIRPSAPLAVNISLNQDSSIPLKNNDKASDVQLTNEELLAQVKEMKRLADLKAEEEKADKRPITKINYIIDKVSKDATMRIERDNQPLSLVVLQKFGLKQLGFSEWIEVHTLASKTKGKAIDTLLKNLKAKFEWIKTQAGKLGLPSLPELSAFGLSAAKKKRKKASEILKEVFVTEDIKRGTPQAEEMMKKLKFTIKARNDVEQATKIIRDNLDDGGM
nr:hypothetical protein [Tanacetum cinerariifolium]